jgi:two-component system sensor histidine kinase RegB
MASALEPEVSVPWLIRLRWWVLGGQLLALGAAAYLELPVTWWMYLTALGVGVLSNALLAAGRYPARRSSSQVLGGVMMLDVALLTALLAASGGESNPFTVLFLVDITLSAVVLSARWTTAIALLAVGGFGLLFVLPDGASVGHAGHAHHGRPGTSGLGHLEGMWIAFVLATALTAYFVRRISHAIATQRDQIAALRETAARNARLASLTTLAAGAAHELGSPLGTIAIAAHEARRDAEAKEGMRGLIDDLRLIELEVERCQDVLHRMAARASQVGGDEHPLTQDELVARIREHLGERQQLVDVSLTTRGLAFHLPGEQMAQSVVALIRNGLDASQNGGRVTVELSEHRDDVRLSVQDHGSGIADADLQRIGEPFFTTKQPGRGLGLGVFLARAFVESQGGTLTIESVSGVGTRAVIELPRAVVHPAMRAA